MSSQADILDISGSGDTARKAFGLGPSSLTVFPFLEWKAAWQGLAGFRATGQRLVVLLGDPGVGKSTMLESLADSLTSDGKSVTRFRGVQLDDHDFLHLVSISLGLNADVYEPQALQAQLRAHLQAETANHELYFLVDEADVLGPSALASLLELADLPLLETAREPAPTAGEKRSGEAGHALGINTSGAAPPSQQRHDSCNEPLPRAFGDHAAQGGLRIVLAGPHSLLRVLAQCPVDLAGGSNLGLVTLGALRKSEIEGYLLHCLARSVETEGITISAGAADAIHLYSQGIPRVLNRMAVRLFFCGPGSGSRCISPSDVTRVARELQSEGLLTAVPFPTGLTLEDTAGVQTGDAGLAGAPELAAEIDKPVAALIASELEKGQFDDDAAVPGRPDEETRQPPRSTRSKAIHENRPVSDPKSRRERMLIPAFGLVILALAVVVGLRFWTQDTPTDESTIQDPGRSGEPLAGAGGDKKSPLGSAFEESASSPTVLAPKPPEPTPKLERELPAAAPPVARPPEIEQAHRVAKKPPALTVEEIAANAAKSPEPPPRPKREIPAAAPLPEVEQERRMAKKPPALNAEETSAIAAKHRDLASSKIPAAVGRDSAPTLTIDVVEEPVAVSSGVAAASNEEAIGRSNLDEQGRVEAVEKLTPMTGKPDPASVNPPPSLTSDKALALSIFGPGATSHDGPDAVVESPMPALTSDRSDLALLERKRTDLGTQNPPAEAGGETPLEQLLRAAEIDMQSNRLTTPKGENAFHRYQAVLEIDPENGEALEGLESIVRSYVVLVKRALADGDLDRAIAYLDRADAVLPEFPETADLRVQIEDELSTDSDVVQSEDSPQSAPKTGSPLVERFVVLPPRTTPGCAWPFDRHMIDAVSDLIRRAPLNRVVLSAPRSNSDPGGQQMGGLWTGSAPNLVPDKRQVFRYGERVGARWVLLSRIDCPASASVFEPWRDFQLHLFDIERGVLHQGTGTLGEITSITERVLLSSVAVEGG